jgi:hypothetical protein
MREIIFTYDAYKLIGKPSPNPLYGKRQFDALCPSLLMKLA